MNTDEAHTNYQEFKNWHRKDFWKPYSSSPADKVHTFYLTNAEYKDLVKFQDSGFVKIITNNPSYEHNGIVVKFVLTELARIRLRFDYEL